MKKLIASVSGFVGYLMVAGYAFADTAADTNLCPTTAQGVKVGALCQLGVSDLVSKAISIVLFIAFVAALLYLIYGGIRWIMSGGDKEATGKAKGTVTAALIGLAIVLGSWILINLILTLFGGGSLNALSLPSLVN